MPLICSAFTCLLTLWKSQFASLPIHYRGLRARTHASDTARSTKQLTPWLYIILPQITKPYSEALSKRTMQQYPPWSIIFQWTNDCCKIYAMLPDWLPVQECSFHRINQSLSLSPQSVLLLILVSTSQMLSTTHTHINLAYGMSEEKLLLLQFLAQKHCLVIFGYFLQRMENSPVWIAGWELFWCNMMCCYGWKNFCTDVEMLHKKSFH